MENKSNPQTNAENRGIDRIRDEMAANPDSAGIQAVGEAISQAAATDADLARHIAGADPAKTLKGAFAAMQNYASANRKNNFFFADTACFAEIVIKGYYGYGGAINQAAPVHAPQAAALDDLFTL